LDEGRVSHKDLTNVSFHLCSIYDLEQFVAEQNIEEEVDLITMGECFHWFDTERALAALHRVVSKSNGLVAIWGYRYPYFVSKNLYEDCVRNNE